MAVQYLKKKKLREIAMDIFGSDNIKNCSCEYKFYRGMEWLTIYSLSGVFQLCASCGGNYLKAELFVYDDDLKLIRTSKKVFNGFGKYEYAIN